MSLKPLETHITATKSLYAPYTTTGGGGGGGSSVVTSSLTVSTLVGLGGAPIEVPTEMSISSIAGPNPNGTLVQNGFEFLPGAAILFDTKPAPADDITFNGNDGAIGGLSTINGVPWNAAAVSASLSTATGTVTAGSAPVALTPVAISTTAGKCYMAGINIDGAGLATLPAAALPTPGDHCAILADTNILGTIDLVSLSSMKGKGQPLGFSFAGPFVASGAGMQFTAYCSANATVSTFLVTSGPAWITPLN